MCVLDYFLHGQLQSLSPAISGILRFTERRAYVFVIYYVLSISQLIYMPSSYVFYWIIKETGSDACMSVFGVPLGGFPACCVRSNQYQAMDLYR
jgi:hypothetical protein